MDVKKVYKVMWSIIKLKRASDNLSSTQPRPFADLPIAPPPPPNPSQTFRSSSCST